MSSKRRLRRKACDGKVKHADREGALAQLRHSKRDERDSLGVYQCKHCRHWHIGHRRGARYQIRPKLARFLNQMADAR